MSQRLIHIGDLIMKAIEDGGPLTAQWMLTGRGGFINDSSYDLSFDTPDGTVAIVISRVDEEEE